jgi:hypothetical protein
MMPILGMIAIILFYCPGLMLIGMAINYFETRKKGN